MYFLPYGPSAVAQEGPPATPWRQHSDAYRFGTGGCRPTHTSPTRSCDRASCLLCVLLTPAFLERPPCGRRGKKRRERGALCLCLWLCLWLCLCTCACACAFFCAVDCVCARAGAGPVCMALCCLTCCRPDLLRHGKQRLVRPALACLRPCQARRVTSGRHQTADSASPPVQDGQETRPCRTGGGRRLWPMCWSAEDGMTTDR